jgi:hypothetical protein
VIDVNGDPISSPQLPSIETPVPQALIDHVFKEMREKGEATRKTMEETIKRISEPAHCQQNAAVNVDNQNVKVAYNTRVAQKVHIWYPECPLGVILSFVETSDGDEDETIRSVMAWIERQGAGSSGSGPAVDTGASSESDSNRTAWDQMD